jgi:hypothetical protein
MMSEAEVLRHSLLNLQVCVPEEWCDDEIVAFAESECPCGTTNGWFVSTEQLPSGDEPRVACANRDGFVHVVLMA